LLVVWVLSDILLWWEETPTPWYHRFTLLKKIHDIFK
jgi:hypothetical protein